MAGAMNAGHNNVAVGKGALASITTSQRNVAVGNNALTSLTATGTADLGNIAIGYGAADGLQTGMSNIAIGVAAMDAATGAVSNCVIIGERAGDAINSTDSDGTVAIGYYAASANVSGIGNVAVGYQSLLAADQADACTAIGHMCLSDVTIDNDGHHTFVGYQSGRGVVSGSQNTGIGSKVMGNNAKTISGSNNVAVGYQVMQNATGDVNSNIGMGTNALDALTAGDDNIAIGQDCAQLLTTGVKNVAIGTGAFDRASLGEEGNVAIGYEAMGALTEDATSSSVNQNVAIGQSALLGGVLASSEAVNQNVAVGYQAMYNTGGSPQTGVVAIGAFALTALTTGERNLAIGYQAMDALTIGDDNIAIGYDALGAMAATDGNDKNLAIGQYALANAGASSNVASANVCVGYSAGVQVTTGDHNVLIGMNSGVAINVGRKNICIGTGAGETITASDECVSIGYDSDCASDADASIAIGAFALATAAECICIGNNITNSTTRTVKFGDGGASMISLDWDTSGDSTWTRSSDRRRKRNIKDNTLGLEFINKLQTRTFQLKPQNELPKEWVNYSETNRYDTEKIHVGFIAQEIKALIDEYDAPDEVASWSEDSDGMQRAGETKLITPLIKAVQELSAKNDLLEAKIKALEDAQ